MIIVHLKTEYGCQTYGQEITLLTTLIQHIDGEGEIALCILSAINLGKMSSKEMMEEYCDLAVRGLEELIDHQN